MTLRQSARARLSWAVRDTQRAVAQGGKLPHGYSILWDAIIEGAVLRV